MAESDLGIAIKTNKTKSFWKSKKVKNILCSYAFILPFLIFLALFAVLPVLWVFKLSFQDGGILEPATWVGLENYKAVFNDSKYLKYFLNNFTFILMTVPFGQLIAFTLAVLLKKKTKASAFFESVFFLPLLISMVAAGIMIMYIFGMNGPINYVLGLLGAGEINWLGKPFTAKITISAMEIWKGATFFTFVYIAALRAIPHDYYEVAYIEGANPFKVLMKVTIPLIKNTALFCFVMTTMWQLQIFDSIYVTTFGGPLEATTSIVFAIYQTTFKHFHTGLGSALSIIFLVVILIISLIQMSLNKSDVEY